MLLWLLQQVYDPLYFDHSDDDTDPFLCVRCHYSREAASYTRLSDLQGTVIAAYYGSYSLELPVDDDEAKTRTVRLILIEYIPGSSMQQLQPQDFSQLEQKQSSNMLSTGNQPFTPATYDLVTYTQEM